MCFASLVRRFVHALGYRPTDKDKDTGRKYQIVDFYFTRWEKKMFDNNICCKKYYFFLLRMQAQTYVLKLMKENENRMQPMRKI